MAEVFLAKAAGPMGFEKTLVLKRILPDLAGDPVFVRMFLAEAKLAASLNHPNIAQIFDFGQEQGAYFIAMEYVDGPNLRSLSRRSAERSSSELVGRPLTVVMPAMQSQRRRSPRRSSSPEPKSTRSRRRPRRYR